MKAPRISTLSRVGLPLSTAAAALLIAAAPVPPASPPSSEDAITLPAGGIPVLVRTAEELMNREAWPQAALAWSQVERADPGLATAAYNRGVAEYRAGDMEAAADAFRRAGEIGDAGLAARAMYNEGTARYAEAVRRLADDEGSEATPPANPEDDAPIDPIKDAMERVGRSLDHFRDAIDADPANKDARANAELAHRLLQQLREFQEQQDQQQGDQEQQNQQQGDQEQQDQQQGDQEQQEQQQGDQDQQEQQQGDQEQQEQQQGDQEQQEQQQGDQEQQQETDGSASAEKSDDETSEAAKAGEERMSREEAERLLQSVRDKERQRRKARAEAETRSEDRRPPVRKDW